MSSQLINISNLDQDKIDLIKRTICKGATDDELQLFIHACNRTKLDPFMRQIYGIMRDTWDKEEKRYKKILSIQTGIDGYRLIADRTGKYMPGRDCTFSYKDDKIISATAYVKKLGSDGQWHEIPHTVYWDEYAPKSKDGVITGQWKDKPHIMLGKCAEASCLRKAFPADLSGIYTKEEMEQADTDNTNTIEATDNKKVEAKKIDIITEEEAKTIEDNIFPEDSEYRLNLLTYFSNLMNPAEKFIDFSRLPRTMYEKCMRSVMRRRDELLKQKQEERVKEVEEVIEEEDSETVPF